MNMGVTRIVRNGAVKIGGQTYRPQSNHMEYDGRLDGKRLLFGRYRKPGTTNEFEPFVNLCDDDESQVDGNFPWLFWYAVKKENA